MVRARPLLVYVVALALALTLPPLALAVVIAKNWVDAEQIRLQARTGELNDNAMAQVERYLAGKIAMLQALATSPSLDEDDFQKLDRQARELLDLQGANIVLRSLDGQQHVNTRRPWGTKLPRVPNYEIDREVARSAQPRISDLYPGVMAGAPLIRVVVPVLRSGRVLYTLTASLPPASLTQLLQDAGMTAPHFGSIADRNGHILARGVHDPELVGTDLSGFATAIGPRGTWKGQNPAGVNVFGTYRRSQLAGWLFTAGIDQSELDRPLYRSLFLIATLAVAIGLLAFLLSVLIVRRVLQSHQQLTDAAQALGRGARVRPPMTPVREANLIGEALADASSRLSEQAAALTAANRDLERRVDERTREVSAQAMLLEATLDNMAQGLMVVDSEGYIPICNRRAMDLLGLPASLMDANPTFEAVLRFQLERDDFAKSGDLLRAWVESGGIERHAHKYERERPDGTVLEINTVPMADGGMVRTYTDITTHRQAERLAHHMARHDPLTGLSNRTLFRETLNDALAPGTAEAFALLWLDLDRFKHVNDSLGHPAGDALLRLVAHRISQIVGANATVARLGGDEFTVLITNRDPAATAEHLAGRLVASLSEPYRLDGVPADVGVSIGIAIHPRDGNDADQLLKAADMALYRAKSEGRNTYRFYEATMDVAAQERQALEVDLRAALSRGEFTLRYQPIVSIESRIVRSFEALIRWHHPMHGEIPPLAFVGLAEDTKLIGPIGEWVLREACRVAAAWPADIQVSVNISAVQFEDARLVQTVMSALAAAGLPARRLELEITESVLMREGDGVVHTLAALRALGVRIALDDFGTGYSSLSYLHRFPVDRIKIDRSFIKGAGDPTTAAIVRTIVGLGVGLGAAITAEGVETEEQLDFVRREGCTDVQGFLFSRPLEQADADEIAHGRLALAA